MKIVTMTAYNRPEFLTQVIESIKCAENYKDYTYMMSVDPSDKTPEILELMENFRVEKVVKVNPNRFGCPKNTGHALVRGFNRGAKFVIHIEDDCVIAPDFFMYMEWAREKFLNDLSVCYVSGWQRTKAGEINEVTFRNHFTPWGFGLWKRTFDEVWPQWDFDYSFNGWDWNLRRLLGGRLEVYPGISRVQNIGYYGQHVPTKEFHEREQHSLCVSENREPLEWNIANS